MSGAPGDFAGMQRTNPPAASKKKQRGQHTTALPLFLLQDGRGSGARARECEHPFRTTILPSDKVVPTAQA